MSSQNSHPKVRLFLIGCGTPTPTPQRFGSCFVLQVQNENLMFDCGPASTYKMYGGWGYPRSTLVICFLPITITITTLIIHVFCCAAGTMKEGMCRG